MLYQEHIYRWVGQLSPLLLLHQRQEAVEPLQLSRFLKLTDQGSERNVTVRIFDDKRAVVYISSG